jgi:GGDEF domain-containing protein
MAVSLSLSLVFLAGIAFILLISSWLQYRTRAVGRQIINSILEAAAIPAYRQSLPQLRKELSRARRLQSPLAIVVIQLNSREHKDATNEGSVDQSNQLHELQLLEFVLCGSTFRDALRETDIATYDGVKKQFVISLPESTKKDAIQSVKRLKDVVSKATADHLSVGIAEFPEDGLIIEDLINRATERLNPETAIAVLDGQIKRHA